MNKITATPFLVVAIVVALYVLATVLIYVYQRKLMYHPEQPIPLSDAAVRSELMFEFEEVSIGTADNLQIGGWFHFKNFDRKTILYLHGNASNLANRISKLNALAMLDVNILIIAWRGFEGNPGEPSEQGLYADAKGALQWLGEYGVGMSNVVLYGESLGAAVAIEVSQRNNVAGVILESAFTSMVDMGQKLYPLLPVTLLIKDRYETKNKISNVTSPIMIMHGKQDAVVPFAMGEELYRLANEPKSHYFTDHDPHMIEFNRVLLRQMNQFLQSLITVSR